MQGGLPGFAVIGATGAAKHAADRVKTALAAVGVPLPQARVLVSLAPADLAKYGRPLRPRARGRDPAPAG